MTTEQLQTELAESKAEIQRLKERLSIGPKTIQKDLSLVTLVQKWPGSEPSVPLEDFLTSIELVSRMVNWEDRDKFEIALLKLTVSAKLFHQGCPELHKPNANWQTFKEQFSKRYRDV
jgi:hypothetical protein